MSRRRRPEDLLDTLNAIKVKVEKKYSTEAMDESNKSNVDMASTRYLIQMIRYREKLIKDDLDPVHLHKFNKFLVTILMELKPDDEMYLKAFKLLGHDDLLAFLSNSEIPGEQRLAVIDLMFQKENAKAPHNLLAEMRDLDVTDKTALKGFMRNLQLLSIDTWGRYECVHTVENSTPGYRSSFLTFLFYSSFQKGDLEKFKDIGNSIYPDEEGKSIQWDNQRSLFNNFLNVFAYLDDLHQILSESTDLKELTVRDLNRLSYLYGQEVQYLIRAQVPGVVIESVRIVSKKLGSKFLELWKLGLALGDDRTTRIVKHRLIPLTQKQVEALPSEQKRTYALKQEGGFNWPEICALTRIQKRTLILTALIHPLIDRLLSEDQARSVFEYINVHLEICLSWKERMLKDDKKDISSDSIAFEDRYSRVVSEFRELKLLIELARKNNVIYANLNQGKAAECLTTHKQVKDRLFVLQNLRMLYHNIIDPLIACIRQLFLTGEKRIDEGLSGQLEEALVRLQDEDVFIMSHWKPFCDLRDENISEQSFIKSILSEAHSPSLNDLIQAAEAALAKKPAGVGLFSRRGDSAESRESAFDIFLNEQYSPETRSDREAQGPYYGMVLGGGESSYVRHKKTSQSAWQTGVEEGALILRMRASASAPAAAVGRRERTAPVIPQSDNPYTGMQL